MMLGIERRIEMCKYCEKDKNGCTGWNDLSPYVGVYDGDYAEFSVNGNTLMFHFLDKHTDETFKTEIDFCPKCGTPLGEVKPLTVEQLRQMDGKPVFLKTGEILINEQIIGRWNIIHSVSDTHAVFMGGGNGFRLDNYGTTWLAYLQEPKGETE